MSRAQKAWEEAQRKQLVCIFKMNFKFKECFLLFPTFFKNTFFFEKFHFQNHQKEDRADEIDAKEEGLFSHFYLIIFFEKNINIYYFVTFFFFKKKM